MIKGGNRLISTDDDLILDGSESKYTVDGTTALANNRMDLLWRCINMTSNSICKFANNSVFPDSINRLIIYIPAYSFIVPPGAFHVLRIFLNVTYYSSSDETYTDYNYTSSPGILPTIVTTTKSWQVNYNEVIILKCNIAAIDNNENSTGNINYNDIPAHFLIFSWSISPNIASSSALGWDTAYLKIYPRQLSNFYEYVATCTVYDKTNASQLVGQSSTHVYMNRSPTSPSLQIYPDVGIAGITKFSFYANGATDADMPLRYQYFFQIRSGKYAMDTFSPLSGELMDGSFTTVLPMGGGSNYDLEIKIRVYDSLNASSADVVATVSVLQMGSEIGTEELLKKIISSNSMYELRGIISSKISSNIIRTTLNKTASILNEINSNLSSYNLINQVSTDIAAIDILNLLQPYLVQAEGDFDLFESLSTQIVARETNRINTMINSIEENELKKKKVNVGLPKEVCIQLTEIYSKLAKQKKKLSLNNEKDLVNIGRSIMKDDIIGENFTIERTTFSMHTMKLSQCQVNASEEIETSISGDIGGMKYSLPKCALIPWKNKYYARPYDLIILNTAPEYKEISGINISSRSNNTSGSKTSRFLSNITSLYLFDDTKKEMVTLNNLKENITLKFAYNPSDAPIIDYISCVTRGEFNNGSFNSSTVYTDSSSSSTKLIGCLSNHFSEYALIYIAIDIKYLYSISFWIIVILAIFSVVLILISTYIDFKEDKGLGKILDKKAAELSVEKDTIFSRPPTTDQVVNIRQVLPTNSIFTNYALAGQKRSSNDLIVSQTQKKVEEISVAKYMDLERDEQEPIPKPPMGVCKVLLMILMVRKNGKILMLKF